MLPDLIRRRRCPAVAEPGDAWGELHLRSARPDAGQPVDRRWAGRDRRGLKHRAEGESRRVPCPPALATLLRDHLADSAARPEDPLFRGVQGRPLATITYRRAWDRARERFDGRGVPLPASPPTLRPPPRMPFHLAQRRSSSNPGRRMGRPQRRGPAPRLRQVPRGPRRDRQAPDRCRPG